MGFGAKIELQQFLSKAIFPHPSPARISSSCPSPSLQINSSKAFKDTFTDSFDHWTTTAFSKTAFSKSQSEEN